MKVAVIGSNGQLGSDLITVLQDRGHEAIALTHADIEVRDADSVQRCLSAAAPEAVVNCAAYVRVDDAETNAVEAMNINAIGALNVARACRDIQARCVYISTDFVFDGDQTTPYQETDRVNPINIYGMSKLAGEHLVMEACPDWTVGRVSSLFGQAGSSGKGGNFIEAIIAKAKKDGKLSVVDDITITPTYTADAAEAIEELIEKGSSGTYHITNTGPCTWYQFAKEALALAHAAEEINPVSSVEYPSKAKRPANSALSTDKLSKTIGRRLPPWQEALSRYLEVKGHLSTSDVH